MKKTGKSRYGYMILAAVLLTALCCAGAAGADAQNTTIASWQELEQNITDWGSNTEQLTIVLGNSLTCSDGSAIFVTGNVTLMPAEQTDCRIDANQSGRFFYISGDNASLTLKGNTGATLNLTGGSQYSAGGAIWVEEMGTLTLAAGSMITGCSAADGGAVYVYGGTLIMNGGTISGCSAVNGGAVYVEEGTLIMNSGTISNCSAEDEEYGSTAYGGGVYLGSGTFTMNGGTITGCSAQGTNADQGGGIYLASGTFAMTGGTIAQNTAAMGSGVFTSIPLTVSGTAGIAGDNSVALLRDDYEEFCTQIHILNPDSFSGCIANITLYEMNHDFMHYGWMESPGAWINKVVVGNGTAAQDKVSLSASSLYEGCSLYSDGSDLKLALPAYVEVSSWEQLMQKVYEWTDTVQLRTVAVSADITDRTDQNTESITVRGNVLLTPTVSPAGSGNNEAVIDGKEAGNLFTVMTGGNLTLCGNGTATLNLTGGTAGFSSMYMGGGIYVVGGNLTLADNAKITGCSASYGGGVTVFYNGTFTMNGGSIANCTAGFFGFGGGVAISNGTFTMNGGSIANCSAVYGGGVLNVQTFVMNGGTIAGNDAQLGAGVFDIGAFYLCGPATVSGTNAVLLCSQGEYYQPMTVTGPFTGQIGPITLCDGDLTENPSVWLQQVIVKNGSTAPDRFSLATSDLYKGCRLSEQNDDIILTFNTAHVTASGGVAQFGNNNYTVVDSTAQSTVSGILLKDVSHVLDENVEFAAASTTITAPPSVAGYTTQNLSVFDLAATANGTSRFNLTVSFVDAETAAAHKNNVRVFHYNTTDMNWDDNWLPGSIVDDDGVNVTCQVETVSFSPFGIGIYTPVTYTVHFDANGGQGSMDDMTFTYDEGQNLTANAFQRYNSNFLYWTCNGTRYDNTEFVQNLTTEDGDIVTMTAQWETYSTGGSSSGTSYLDSSDVSVIATAAPTAAPTVKPTEKPATPTVVATEKPTTQPTQSSPAPFVGILAGLGAAAVLLRLRR